jgi:hypothetical protein
MQLCSRFTHPYVLSVLNKLKYNSKTSSFRSGKVLTLSAPSENVDYCAQQQGKVYDGVYAMVQGQVWMSIVVKQGQVDSWDLW